MPANHRQLGKLRLIRISRSGYRRCLATDLETQIKAASIARVNVILIHTCDVGALNKKECDVINGAANRGAFSEVGIVCTSQERQRLRSIGLHPSISLFCSLNVALGSDGFRSACLADVHAVVFAGRMPRSLGPLTQSKPAALLPLGSETYIERSLNLISNLGVQSGTVVLGDRAPRVRDAIRSRFKGQLHLNFVADGAFRDGVWAHIGRTRLEGLLSSYNLGFGWDRTTLVLDALSVCNLDIGSAIIEHELNDLALTQGLLDQDVGFAVLSTGALNVLAKCGSLGLKGGLAKAAKCFAPSQINRLHVPGHSAQTAKGFFATQNHHWAELGTNMTGYFRLENGALCHKTAQIRGNIQTSPQTVISENASIENGVRLEGKVIVSAGAHLGEGALIKDSWIAPGAIVPPRDWVSQMLVGDDWALDYHHAKAAPFKTASLHTETYRDTLEKLLDKIA